MPTAIAMIENFLIEAISFREFSRSFREYILDVVDYDSLSEMDKSFVDVVYEQLEFRTAEDGTQIDSQSRADGWITSAEFKVWLQEKYAEFVARRGLTGSGLES